jgi:DNA-binding transcriptional regulator YiaG
MKAHQFQRALLKLNLTHRQAADLLRTNIRTIRRWSSGESLVPAPIALLLNLLVDTGTMPDQLRR